jgi:hypothetical protein
VQDDGGTDNGGVDTVTHTFTVIVIGVNDPPTFVAGADQSTTDESGPQVIAPWATAISAGPPDEAGQSLKFEVQSNSNKTLFAMQPTIDANGTLSYTPAPNVSGTATITVALRDDGGTDHGGVDTSPPQTFTITVTKPHVWYNAASALDVNNDSRLSSIDALLVINYVNNKLPTIILPTAAIGPPFLDTNHDNNVSSIDALLVINAINNGQSGEGESAAPPSALSESAIRPELDQQSDLTSLITLLAVDTAGAAKRRRSP